MKATRLFRKPFPAWAHQVTEKNIDTIAEWCQGVVVKNTDRMFIRVPVMNARNPRQTEAGIGCWVVKAKRYNKASFKVYTQRELEKDFWALEGDWAGDEELNYTMPPEAMGGQTPPTIVRQASPLSTQWAE